jgi:hypothetical protein
MSVATDTGRAVALLLENYDTLNLKHRSSNFADRLYTGQEMFDILAESTGREVVWATFPTLGEAGSDYDRVRALLSFRAGPSSY